MKLLKIAFISLVLIGILVGVVVHFAVGHATSYLVDPPRRQLQDYHADWLETPEDNGIRIDKATLHNQTPCLIVNPAGQPAKRGKLLRQQLAERNVSLPTFGKVTGQLIIIHGRSSRKEDFLPVAERFSAIGLRCLIPDLPGHGENPAAVFGFGSAKGEDQLISNIYQDAIDSKLMTEGLPTSIIGMSMGGAYAVKTAQHNSSWNSLTILCSLDSLEAIIDSQSNKRVGPLGPLLASLVKKRTESKTGLNLKSIAPKNWAKEIHIPVMVAHGTHDELIPLANGKNLYHSFSSKQKKWMEVTDANHSDILVTKTLVNAPIGEWILSHH